MAQTTEQLQDTEPLGARIDSLLENIEQATQSVRAELNAASAENAAPAPSSAPTPSGDAGPTATVSAPAEPQTAERDAHFASHQDSAPAMPEPAASTAPTDAGPTDPGVAAMQAVSAELNFISPDAIEESQPTLSPADEAAMRAALTSDAAAPAAVSDPGPAPSIQELDDALAEQATAAVEAAISDAAARVKEAAAEPVPSAPAPVAIVPVSTSVATVAPVVALVAEKPVTVAHTAPTPAAPVRPVGPSRTLVLAARALAPVTRVTDRVPEPTRQTVGYLALMTAFFGAAMWGIVLLRQPHQPAPIVSVPLAREGHAAPDHFDPSSAAERSAVAAHGGEHTEADAHGKSDSHGKAGEKPSKPAEKKKSGGAKKPDAHGGGGHH